MYVNNIAPLEGTTINVASGSTLYAPGSVVQVVQVVKTDTYSMAAASWTDITGYSVSITPSSSSSKVLINWHLDVGSTDDRPDGMLRLLRDSTAICIGASNGGTDFVTHHFSGPSGSFPGNDVNNISGMFLDSPATTSSITYKFQIRNWSQSDTLSVGRRATNTSFQAPSTITAMEIAG
jgi:hypothetical protein